MQKNISKPDRIIRFIIGLVALWLAYTYSLWWLILAIIAIWTSLSGKCLLYKLLSKKKSKPMPKPVAKKKKK